MPGSGYDILNGGKGKDLYYLSDTNDMVIIQHYAREKAIDEVDKHVKSGLYKEQQWPYNTVR